MLTTGRAGLIKRGRIFFEKGKKCALQVGFFGLVFCGPSGYGKTYAAVLSSVFAALRRDRPSPKAMARQAGKLVKENFFEKVTFLL